MTIVILCEVMESGVVCAAEVNKLAALLLRFLERDSVKPITVFHGTLKQAIITYAKILTFHFRYKFDPFQSLSYRSNLGGCHNGQRTLQYFLNLRIFFFWLLI